MTSSAAEFDQYADSYDQLLNTALSATGESKEYFADGRVRRVAELLHRLNYPPCHRAMDFGCGTGSSTPFLKKYFPAAHLVGVDNSDQSVRIATAEHGSNAIFHNVTSPEMCSASDFDLAITNGVFHHIPSADRQRWLEWIRQRLRPGALFAFFENNPWNPGTRYVMNRCEFDRGAITLSIREARRRLLDAGFQHVTEEHLFFFPNSLRSLRSIERFLRYVPVGGQYLCLVRSAD
jgi:trans-aconitate methyltransferase